MEQVTAAERLERARNAVPAQQPLTQDDVLGLIKKNKNNLDVVYKTLDERKVNFDLDRKIEQKMRGAGADDDMLQAIWKAGPTGRSEKSATLTSATGAPLQATYEEAMGFKTMEHELDPDRRLRMVDEFESRFPKSQFLSYVYLQAAKAYQEKSDLNKLVEYGEKSLKQDPDNVFSLVVVALALPQPRMLQGSPGRLPNGFRLRRLTPIGPSSSSIACPLGRMKAPSNCRSRRVLLPRTRTPPLAWSIWTAMSLRRPSKNSRPQSP